MIARAIRGGWEKKAANPPQPRMAWPRYAKGRQNGDEHQSLGVVIMAALLR
jgi:hypothetical protein